MEILTPISLYLSIHLIGPASQIWSTPLWPICPHLDSRALTISDVSEITKPNVQLSCMYRVYKIRVEKNCYFFSIQCAINLYFHDFFLWRIIKPKHCISLVDMKLKYKKLTWDSGDRLVLSIFWIFDEQVQFTVHL